MARLEVLCATMHQNDFSKIEQMNIRTDVVFANQAEGYSYREYAFEGHTAKMITTATRGVGKNRNTALLHASAEYCLLADDDVVYADDMPERVIAEFEAHPDADVMVFHLDSLSESRHLKKYPKTQKWPWYKGLAWGGVRIAFRLSSVRKANVWFTTLFGGGAKFSSGEDSLFLTELRRAGLTFYVSKETIGKVSFEKSSWFTGHNESFFYGKGAFYQAARRRTKYIWFFYMALKKRREKELSFAEKVRWMCRGAEGFRKLMDYESFIKSHQ